MRRNRKGFTLVEAIVTLSILTVVIALSSMLILSGGETVTRNSVTNAEKFIGDAVCEWMEARVRYSTKLSIAPNGADKAGAAAFTVQDGRLLYADSTTAFFNLYGDEFYYNHTVDFTASLRTVADGDERVQMLTLTVNVYRAQESEPAYTATADVRLLNMGLFNNAATDTAGQGAVNPVLSFSSEATAAGSADDPTVNELLIRAQLMREQYDLWLRRYTESGNSSAILSQFYDAFYLTGTNKQFNLQREDYYAYLRARLGDSWIDFDDTLLEPIKTSDLSFYNYLTGKIDLEVRIFFPALQKGRLEGDAFCYAINGNNQPWGAFLVYNMRDQSWYYYDKPGQYSGFDSFNVADLSQGKTVDELYDQIESGGNWHKL